MAVQTTRSFCRQCHAFCAIDVDIEENRVVAVRGDAENPISGGYSCIKGRSLPEQHNLPARLRNSLKRQPDGSYQPIPAGQAMDEVAVRLHDIIRKYGPRAVATYNGTHAYQNAAALPFIRAWHKGIGSPSFFTSASIDQPGKQVAGIRHGVWAGGDQAFDDSDVHLMIGCNPVVSMWAGVKFPAYNPWRRLRDAKKRGLKLIVIDPRRTEVARRADIHLQVKPGEDPTLLAGIIRVILAEGLYDGDFCAAYVEGVEWLRQAVQGFTPDYVEARAGVPAEMVVRAARTFAAGPRGMATTGTGPSMAPRSNLSEQLAITLNTICGRYLRAGEPVRNPGTLTPPVPRLSQVIQGRSVPRAGEPSRIKGLGAFFPDGDMPATVLAEEILTPGEGQVRALITVGGNPVAAWPDQLRTIEAMEALELNVTIDVRMSATARFCHYVVAPKMSLERPDATLMCDQWFPEPYAQYTPACVTPGFDVIEEWEFFWGLAKRLGTAIVLPGGPVAMDRKPSSDEILDLVTAGSRVPLAEVRKHPGGAIFPVDVRVQPGRAPRPARLRAGEPEMIEALRDVRAEPLTGHAGYVQGEPFTHRLISRRLREVSNSSGRDLPAIVALGLTTNPACMNPADLAELGLRVGDLVEIVSDRAAIPAIVEAADDVPAGVISMANGWGDTPAHDHLVRQIGSPTSRLVSLDRDREPHTGMARQSAIPVKVRPVAPV